MPWSRMPFEVVLDILTSAGLIGIMAMIIWIRVALPFITESGPLSANNTRYMILGITVLATFFSIIVANRIRHLFLRNFETPLRNIAAPREGVSPLLDPVALESEERHKAIETLDRKWRGALGISKFREMLKNWKFLAVSLVCGLITAAIVTALTPTLASRTVSYYPVIPDANYGEYVNVSSHPCVGMAASDRDLSTAYRWNLNNGSTFYGSTDIGSCPPSLTMALSSGINTHSPNDYVYVDSGIAVQQTAIGASAAIYKSPVLGNFLSDYGLSATNTSQCVPVMQSNPIQCRTGGNLTVVSDQQLRVVSADGNCAHNSVYPYRNFTRDSAMIGTLCVDDASGTSQSIGLMTIVFGAITDPKSANAFASDLAGTVNDPDPTAGLAGGSTYTITCTVNPQNSFVYRTVTLDLQATNMGNNSGYTRYLSGGELCTPVNPTISNILFVTVATANYNLVRENLGLDNYISTIHRIAGFNRGPPYAFANSANALEDTLGLVAALGVSSLQITGGNVSADALDDHGGSAYAVVEATRFGTDNAEYLILLIPPLLSLIILGYLLWKNFRHDWGPGGREYKDMPKDKRPRLYAAESFRELMLLGRFGSLDYQDTRLSAQGLHNKGAQVWGETDDRDALFTRLL